MKLRHWILVASAALAALCIGFGPGSGNGIVIAPPSWVADPELKAALEEDSFAGEASSPVRHELVGSLLGPGGEPRPGLLVGVRGPSTFEFTWTDRDGSFRLTNLEAGALELVGVSPQLPHLRTTIELPRAGPIELNLPTPLGPVQTLPRVQRAALRGRMETSFSESSQGYEIALAPLPRPEATEPIGAWAFGLEGRVPRRVPCEADGSFEVEDLALGPYRISLLPPWANGGSWPLLLERSYEHTSEAPELVLRSQAGRIVGSLSDDRGAPVVGARIEVTDAESPDRVWPPALSAADGGFTVRHLPEGTYRVSVATGEARAEERVRVSALRGSEVSFEGLELRQQQAR